MAHSNTVDIKLNLVSEDLQQAIEMLAKENKKTMATISANTESQEEFSLSGLDYDELLETYGDDPVLMTILNRMKEFFASNIEPNWFEIKDWPEKTKVEPYYTRWDTTTLDTTSKVSDTFTIKYDSSGVANVVTSAGAPKYVINE